MIVLIITVCQALEAQPGLPAEQRPCAAQLAAAALAAVGLPVDLQCPRPLCIACLRQQALGQHLQETSAAAARPGASKLAHHIAAAWASQLPPAEEHTPTPAAYLGSVRQRARRAAVAQLRTGSHCEKWGQLPSSCTWSP